MDWRVCAEWPAWPGAELHLWRGNLSWSSGNAAARRAMLSPDELTRADRFRFELDRDRFIQARSLLRGLLGRYLRQPPESLAFEYGACGKPALATGISKKTLYFNLTHTEDLALIAVTGVAEVGIDAERIGPAPYAKEVAARFFSPQDQVWLRGEAEDFDTERFFQLWTRREASLKAQGAGLFGLTPEGSDPASLSVVNLDVGAGYAAAAALRSPFPPIQTWQWEEVGN